MTTVPQQQQDHVTVDRLPVPVTIEWGGKVGLIEICSDVSLSLVRSGSSASNAMTEATDSC